MQFDIFIVRRHDPRPKIEDADDGGEKRRSGVCSAENGSIRKSDFLILGLRTYVFGAAYG